MKKLKTNEEIRKEIAPLLEKVAVGTDVREGLDRIVRAGTGGLILFGHDKETDKIFTGGIKLNIPFSCEMLRELAKLDGAIILSSDFEKIYMAGVQLVPDASIKATETGMRHRAAQRTSKQTGYPAVAISSSMSTITLYDGENRYMLDRSENISAKISQMIRTLNTYTARFDILLDSLSVLELENLVTVNDICRVIQRIEMNKRTAEEIGYLLIELGADGRIYRMELDDMTSDKDVLEKNLIRDYVPNIKDVDKVYKKLEKLSYEQIVDPVKIAQVLGIAFNSVSMDSRVVPRGYRILSQLARVSTPIINKTISAFQNLQNIMAADIEEIAVSSDINRIHAQTLKDGLGKYFETVVNTSLATKL